jgi:Ca-activated chloride channel family protein
MSASFVAWGVPLDGLLGSSALLGLADGIWGFEVLRPRLALYASVAVFLVLAAGLVLRVSRRRDVLRMGERRHLSRLFPGRAPGRLDARVVLAVLATVLVVMALIGPVRGHSLVPLQRRGVDVVIAVDVSRSMLAEDNEPHRLGRARVEIEAFLKRLEGERVGLVAFAGEAWVEAPLTRDLETLRWYIERLSPDRARSGGTDLGAALKQAAERVGDDVEATRVIVLITDGEDHGGEGLAAAKEIAATGTTVHVLGMGTEGGAKIPDGRGRFVQDEEGRDVVSKLADATLRAIAEESGGMYLRAHGSVLPLERLYDLVISRTDGRDVIDGKERIPHDRYQWPLALAFLAMLVELALRERRGPSA